MSRPSPSAEGYGPWLAKAKKDYYAIANEAQYASEIIWNYPVRPWMLDSTSPKYEIGWADKDALEGVLKKVYKEYGPVTLVAEFHDVGGRVWVGCYFGAIAVRDKSKKQIYLCTKVKVMTHTKANPASTSIEAKSATKASSERDERPQAKIVEQKGTCTNNIEARVLQEEPLREKTFHSTRRGDEKMGVKPRRIRAEQYHSTYFGGIKGKKDKAIDEKEGHWVDVNVDADGEEDDWIMI